MAPVESFNPSLLGSMDNLWFHKIVLSSEPKTCLDKSPLEITSPCLSSSSCSSSESQPTSNSSSEPTDYSDFDDIVQDFSFGVHGSLPIILTTHHKIYTKDEDDNKEMLEKKERENGIKELTSIRPNLVSTPIRRRIKNRLKLERTISCKTLAELEQEEVKGFMDLGFSFEKDRLTPRMMSVIPGLQRFQLEDDDKDEEKEEDNMMVQREAKYKPYLSEAWLIKRPDSPLVRLRVSRPFTSSNEMKKHLKIWAKTVAYSAIQDS